MSGSKPCIECSGRGWIQVFYNGPREPCQVCHGKGELPTAQPPLTSPGAQRRLLNLRVQIGLTERADGTCPRAEHVQDVLKAELRHFEQALWMAAWKVLREKVIGVEAGTISVGVSWDCPAPRLEPAPPAGASPWGGLTGQ